MLRVALSAAAALLFYVGSYGLLRWTGYLGVEYEFPAMVEVHIDMDGRPVTKPSNVVVGPSRDGRMAHAIGCAFTPLAAVEAQLRVDR